MTPQETSDMKSAMHYLAEHILRLPARGNRCKWLKKQLAELLTTNDTVLYYAQKYGDEYQYADVANAYLVEIMKAYDQEVE